MERKEVMNASFALPHGGPSIRINDEVVSKLPAHDGTWLRVTGFGESMIVVRRKGCMEFLLRPSDVSSVRTHRKRKP